MNKYSYEEEKKMNQKLQTNRQEMDELSELFKVFGDSTRIKIMYTLLEKELCVCDIANFIGASQSATSHQLRILKQAKLIAGHKEGKTVYYRLSDDHVKKICEMGCEHIHEL